MADFIRSVRKRFGNVVRAYQFGGSFSGIDIARVGAFEVAYRRCSSDEEVIRDSFDNDTYLAGVPEYRPQPTDTILDIGAYIGTFTLLAASTVPHGKVYAIEPCQDTFNLLRINVALNALRNVEVSRVALADAKGQCTLYYSSDTGNWGHSLFQRGSGRGEEVSTTTLSDYLTEHRIDRCDYVKMNCEGAEFRILLNAPRSVLQRFAVMLVQYHCDLERGHRAEELDACLRDAGFATTIRNCRAERGWLIASNRQGHQQT